MQARPNQIPTRTGAWMAGLAGLVCCLVASPARSQSNLDAGKSPEQIFSDTCSACHHAPQDLKGASAGFLRQHYTTGARQAAAMAAYLERAIHEPRPAPPAPAQPATSFRRPSESVEMDLSANGSTRSPGAAARARSSDSFEE